MEERTLRHRHGPYDGRVPRPRPASLAALAAALLLAGCSLLLPARLAVAPTNALLDLARGPSTLFTVTNEGASGSVLQWRFEAAQLEAWPASGTVASGGSAAVAVFAPAGAEGRTLTGRFVAGRQVVEVSVTVVRGAALTCDPETAYATADDGTARVLVGYEPTLRGASVARADLAAAATAAVAVLGGALERAGVEGGFDLLRVPAARLDAALAALRSSPGVRYAVPDAPVARAAELDDPYYAGQWNLALFGAEPTWDAMDALPGAPGPVVVAVVDDGVAVGHPDFEGRLLPGFDVYDRDDDVRNCTDHGTHVAGIVGAARDAVGVAGVASVPWVQVLPVKAWPDTTSPTATTTIAAILDGMRWAAGLAVAPGVPTNLFPADVVNLSLGTSNAATAPAFADQIGQLRARGIVVVAASGNATDPARAGDGIDYPAAAGALAVGSVDADFERSSFSKYGPGLDLTAPGGFGPNPFCGSDTIVSTGVVYAGGVALEDWTCKAGTSMATPFVSGAAALLLGFDADLRAASDRVALVEDRLRTAAARVPGANVAEYGEGVLCLDALLTDTHLCGVATP